MKIARNLNFVLPIDRDDGSVIYVHSMPLSEEAFDANFLIIAQTFTALYQQRLGPVSGPRVAAKLLKKLAQDAGTWDGDGGVEQSLMAEIRRLSNIVLPGPGGWSSQPWDGAVARDQVSAEDASIVENAIVFFTVASAMYRPAERESVLAGAAQLWDGQTTAQTLMDFASSLPTSKPADSTGGTPAVVVVSSGRASTG